MSETPTHDVGLPTDSHVGSIGETAHDPPDATDRSWLADRSRLLVAIVAIMAVEAALIAANIAFGQREDFPGRLSVTRHLGVPEVLVYLQWLLAAALMWSLRRHGAVYVVWAFVLLYRFAGDILEFHHFLERLLNPGALRLIEPFGAVPAIKEVLGHVVDESTLMILVLLALVAIGRRRPDPIARTFTRRAIALQVMYVVFLVLGEWLFLFVVDDRRVAGILEEAGEMAAATLIFGLALMHAGALSGRREGRSTVGRSTRA
jgi:hypothetical protein